MSLTVTTAPASEPIDLATAKAHLRLDADLTDQDGIVSLLIQAVRERAEHELGRALITQTLKLRVSVQLGVPPALPYQYQALPGILYLQPGNMPVADVQLQNCTADTLQSITSAKLIAFDGTVTTLTSDQWVVNTTLMKPRIMLQNPQTIYDAEIAYVAGWANAAAVPASIKQWMLLQLNTAYENREAFVQGQTLTPLTSGYIDGLIDRYRIPGIV